MIQETFKFLKTNYNPELVLLKVKIPECNEIPSIPFLDAKNLIKKVYNRESTDCEDFDPEEEKLLCEIIKYPLKLY